MALVFLGAGIGVFVVVALGFSRVGIGVFVVAASWHRGLPSSGRHCFFLGENLELRKKGGETLMRRRDGQQAKGSSSEISYENSSRPAARGGRRRGEPERARPERDDARTGEVRQSSDAPSVRRRWQHGSDDGAVDSTSITGYCMCTDDGRSSSSTPGREEETTCRAAILQVAELRQQNDPEAPGNGQSGGPGRVAR